MKLSDNRYEEIKKIVVDMFINYDISCVPISGFEVAMKIGIKIIPYSAIALAKQNLLYDMSEDGFSLEKSTGEWVIYFNDNISSYGRINNTIMHEIGHIVLGHSENSDLAEAEVKFFAKFALVPPVLVHKYKINTPEEIQTFFNVSYEAACNALNYYNKWLNNGNENYTDYELILLTQFEGVIEGVP